MGTVFAGRCLRGATTRWRGRAHSGVGAAVWAHSGVGGRRRGRRGRPRPNPTEPNRTEPNPTRPRRSRSHRLREYFYGVRGELSPQSSTVSFDSVDFYRIGAGIKAPSSTLPIGATTTAGPLRVSAVPPSPALVHSVVAVSHAAGPEEVLSASVAGFLYVTDVDVAARTVTFLAPSPGALPGRVLLLGQIKWIEELDSL